MKLFTILPLSLLAYSPVEDKHTHIASWIQGQTGDQINLSNYGCYCFQSTGLIGASKYEPIDLIDQACKRYRSCITCHNYRYYDQIGEGCSYDENNYTYDQNGCGADTNCQMDLCKCDKRLADEVAELYQHGEYEEAFLSESGFRCGDTFYDDPMMKTVDESDFTEEEAINDNSEIIQNIISAGKIPVEDDSQEKIIAAMEEQEEQADEEVMNIQSVHNFRPMLSKPLKPLKTGANSPQSAEDALENFSTTMYSKDDVSVESKPVSNSFLDSLPSLDNEQNDEPKVGKSVAVQAEKIEDDYELQCCGDSPDWQVFNSAHSDCCIGDTAGSIFNPVNKECCDGRLSNPGTCF